MHDSLVSDVPSWMHPLLDIDGTRRWTHTREQVVEACLEDHLPDHVRILPGRHMLTEHPLEGGERRLSHPPPAITHCSTRGSSILPSPVLSSVTSMASICFVFTSTAMWILRKPLRLLHLVRIHSPLSATLTPEASTARVTRSSGPRRGSRSMVRALTLRQVVV